MLQLVPRCSLPQLELVHTISKTLKNQPHHQPMPENHRLLQRQLKRYLGSATEIPESLQGLIAAVNTAYYQFEEDRMRVERSLELSSQELLETNAKIQTLLDNIEAQVAERTIELKQSNATLETTLQELKQTQAQLVQTEKMSSLGQLVAGVAHEINNPVSFIHGNLTYVNHYTKTLLDLVHTYQRNYPNPVSDVQDELDAIDLDFLVEDLTKLQSSMRMGVDRIKTIVLSLRNFSRLDEAEMKSVDIHEGIESCLLLLQSRLELNTPKIEVLKNYGTLPQIQCYAGQLNQVFMHLLNNAIEALESVSEKIPQICIQTSQQESELLVQISDNGVGMSESMQKQIFNPFFTTKPVGKGTGMGLAISYQVITEQHHGELTCRSTLGEGAAFSIRLPMR